MTNKYNFKDIRDFINFLTKKNEILVIKKEVSMDMEITEIQKRLIENNGPALIIENPIRVDKTKSNIKVIANLFGNEKRISSAINILNDVKEEERLGEIGKILAILKQPNMPENFEQAKAYFPLAKSLLAMRSKIVKKAKCHENIITKDIDVNMLPIQKCWPNDVGPLITWPLVVTKGPKKSSGFFDKNKTNIEDSENLGIYRLQPIAKNKLIVRWLKHRGGATHFKRWQEERGEKFPISIILGCDPATTLAAVTPIPDYLSEYKFASLLRQSPTELVKCQTNDLHVPANAEIIIEGYIDGEEYADEGPYGDHTGYYNKVEKFPVMTITAITHRNDPYYLTTFTGRPPDEPSVLGAALNKIFVPILQKQYSEIIDFYLPPEACSYRVGVVKIKKNYPGHGRQIMLGIWSFLRQFMYTKWLIVVDEDIDIKNWNDVIWAISTRVDPKRDIMFIENSPIDYLDFAAKDLGMGSKIGIDATNKIGVETSNEWGEKIEMDVDIIEKVSKNWHEYGLGDLFK